jgi:hypothetical protein
MQSVISFNGFDPDTFDGMGMAHSLLGDSKNARKPVVWHFDENAFYDGFYMTGSAAFPPTSTKTRANLTTDELEGVDKWHVPMYPSKTGQYKRECTAGTVYTFFWFLITQVVDSPHEDQAHKQDNLCCIWHFWWGGTSS